MSGFAKKFLAGALAHNHGDVVELRRTPGKHPDRLVKFPDDLPSGPGLVGPHPGSQPNSVPRRRTFFDAVGA
jgi:hypothetical protein